MCVDEDSPEYKFVEAPPEPEALLPGALKQVLSANLLDDDWESGVEKAETLKGDFGTLEQIILDNESGEVDGWTSAVLSSSDVGLILTSLAELEWSDAWRLAYSLQHVVADYYDCLLDDEKTVGHLLMRHRIKTKKKLWLEDEDDLYALHVQAHRNDFGHRS
jgi:hypothetical protein